MPEEEEDDGAGIAGVGGAWGTTMERGELVGCEVYDGGVARVAAGKRAEGRRGPERETGGQRGCRGARAVSSSGKQAGGGRARAGVRWPRASVLLAEEGEDTGAPGGLGRQLCH